MCPQLRRIQSWPKNVTNKIVLRFLATTVYMYLTFSTKSKTFFLDSLTKIRASLQNLKKGKKEAGASTNFGKHTISKQNVSNIYTLLFHKNSKWYFCLYLVTMRVSESDGRMVTFWEVPPMPPKNCSLLWSSTTFHIIYYWLFRLTCSCFQSLFWSRVTTFWYPLGGLPHCSRRRSMAVVSIFLASLPFYQYLYLSCSG